MFETITGKPNVREASKSRDSSKQGFKGKTLILRGKMAWPQLWHKDASLFQWLY
jgi:hypothetical protein